MSGCQLRLLQKLEVLFSVFGLLFEVWVEAEDHLVEGDPEGVDVALGVGDEL